MHSVQLEFYLNPPQIVTGCFYSAGKAVGTWRWPLPPSRLWVKNALSYISILSYIYISFPGTNLPLTYAQFHRLSTAAASSSRKINFSFGTESDVELNINLNKSICLHAMIHFKSNLEHNYYLAVFHFTKLLNAFSTNTAYFLHRIHAVLDLTNKVN